MREHLFHGKRKDSGEWIEGYLAAHDLICPSYPEDTLNATGEYCGQVPYVGFVEVDPETVGEYTGMPDKNGKRIFEGDIVHCIARLDEADCVILFEDGEFRLVPTERYATYVTGGGFYALRNFEKEVIGNIHDNPELMEVRDAQTD